MIYFFSVFFWLTILIFNLTEFNYYSLKISFACLISTSIILFAFRKNLKQFIIFLLTWTFSIISAYFIYNYHFTNLQKKLSNLPKWKYIILSWSFIEKLWENKYIFKDKNNLKYYLKTNNKLKLYQKYLIVWKLEKINFLSWNNNLKNFINNSKYKFFKYLQMKWLMWQIHLINYVQLTWNCKKDIFEKIKSFLKEKIIEKFGNNENWALLLWLLIWDKQLMSSRQYRQYIDSQIVHIVAISGWNLILIWTLIHFIFFFLPYYIRLGLALVWITFFTMLVWPDSSIIRAWIMATLTILALFIWRQIMIRRLLAISFALMLAYNPFFLPYDLWFLLSFWAIIWIVILNDIFDKIRIKHEKIYDKIRKNFFWKLWYNLLKDIILPTIWAIIWTLPIILLLVWKTNLLWIIANILVIPIVSITTILWFISLFINIDILVKFVQMCLKYINYISTIFSTHQLSVQIDNIYIKLSILTSIYTLLILTYIYFNRFYLLKK